MPDLSLDEYRGFSKEELRLVLREEAIRAGFGENRFYDEGPHLIDPSCGQSSEG